MTATFAPIHALFTSLTAMLLLGATRSDVSHRVLIVLLLLIVEIRSGVAASDMLCHVMMMMMLVLLPIIFCWQLTHFATITAIILA